MMIELALCGVILAVISAVVLAIGFVTGAIPINYKSLNTNRETAPVTFWALAASWAAFGILGIAIALRHWGG